MRGIVGKRRKNFSRPASKFPALQIFCLLQPVGWDGPQQAQFQSVSPPFHALGI
jgi:hypothetical protein